MIRRRQVITLLCGAAAWPPAARAQQPAMPVVGVLNSTLASAVAAFRSGLSETGHVEGRNVVIEVRAAGQSVRLPALASELVSRQVAVIAALGGLAAPAAKEATATIPIVFSIGGDPVELGLVSNLRRPGGNITGVTFFADELLQKQMGLMRELVPKAVALGVLVNPDNPRHKADAVKVEAAAGPLGFATHVVSAGTELDLVSAFTTLAGRQVGALIVCGDAFFARAATGIAALAARHVIPAIMGTRDFVEVGGTHGLRGGPDTGVPPERHLRGPHPQGREAGRLARHAAHEVRAPHQPQDRQGHRPRLSRHAARPRRRGDRMRRREFITLIGGAATACPLAALSLLKSGP